MSNFHLEGGASPKHPSFRHAKEPGSGIRYHTSVFPIPEAPAIEVISPYRNPPSKASSSSEARPVLTGGNRNLSRVSSTARTVEARSGGAG